MKDPDSSRSVFITLAEGNAAVIDVSQPSDCLLLQRDHVQCSRLDWLVVWFDYMFTNNINGTPEHQSPETWKKAIHHLIDTYRPSRLYLLTRGSHTGIENGHKVELSDGTYRPDRCYVYTRRFNTGIEEGHQVELADEECYRAYWNMTHDELSFAR